ncbi:MAG: cob(I)yrinic acid a,c-diamide adenosyltransferase [bacterium]
MKIYTKTGDDGTTGLFGGARVRKDDLRIEAYGTVDELNSVMGIITTTEGVEHFIDALREIQQSLFVLGADLATPLESKNTYKIPRIELSDVLRIEALIDRMDSELPPLVKFILPGGTPLAALFHFARTECRRAERRLVALSAVEAIGLNDVIYLNRLSDLFFICARRANKFSGVEDIEWGGKKN